MKFSTEQLKKYVSNSLVISDSIDFNEFIEKTDIIKIEKTNVSGSGRYLRDEDAYLFTLDINTKITLECSISLKEVDIDINFTEDFLFRDSDKDEDCFLIDGLTINLANAIFSEIVIKKPIRVVKEGIDPKDYGISNEEDETPKINEVFKSFKEQME